MGFISKVGNKAVSACNHRLRRDAHRPGRIDAATPPEKIRRGPPNDYFIRNINPEKRMFEVAKSVDITTSTA
jgi:hypothetical protein